jgi:hypothetical protein
MIEERAAVPVEKTPMRYRRAPFELVLMLVLALAACSGTTALDEGRSGPSDTESSHVVESVPPATTVPASAIPGDASNITTATADVDGDGTPEEVVTYRSIDGTHHLVTLMATGRIATTDVDGAGEPVPIVAAADLGTGREAVFLETRRTPTSFSLEPYVVTDDGWVAIEATGPAAPTLPIVVSTIPGDVYGVSCELLDDTAGLTLASITEAEGGYRVRTTEYRLESATLVQVGNPTLHRTIIPPGDLSIDAYATVHCS